MSMTLINNKVLVKPVLKPQFYKMKNVDITLEIDVDYEPNIHAERVVEVVRVPDSLSFSKVPNAQTMLWETDIELKEGDTAWVTPLSVTGGEYTNLIKIKTTDQKGVYFLLDYSQFFVAKRKDKVICLNGFVLVQPNVIDIQKKYKHIIIPDIYKDKGNTQSWKVYYTGQRNTAYQNQRQEDFIGELNAGDNVVVYRKRRPYLMEHPMHACFNGKEGYFPIQRCDIVYILDEKN